MRKGRISKEEERTIARLLNSLTPEDIAKKLDRDVESVIDFIKRKFRVGITKEEAEEAFQYITYFLEDVDNEYSS